MNNHLSNRPNYIYEPPSEFFTESADLSNLTVFNVLDYGAVADSSVDNRAAIQNAVDAAHDAGGGLVYIPTGTYGVAKDPNGSGIINVKDHVFIKGDGVGDTSLRVIDNSDDAIAGIITSSNTASHVNYGVADLSLDGNSDNTSGRIDGFLAGSTTNSNADQDVAVLRVESMNQSGYGFADYAKSDRIQMEDNIAHDNAWEGFAVYFVIDGSYENNTAYDNNKHTFDIDNSTDSFLENRTESNHNDSLIGDASDDVFNGGRGDDYINGGAGDDTLKGGGGQDLLNGDSGDDTLKGYPLHLRG